MKYRVKIFQHKTYSYNKVRLFYADGSDAPCKMVYSYSLVKKDVETIDEDEMDKYLGDMFEFEYSLKDSFEVTL